MLSRGSLSREGVMQDRDFTPDDSPAYTAEFNSGETAYAPSRTAAVLAPVPGGRGKSVTRRKPSRPPVAFDEAYLQGLAEGDSEVEAHFVEYFSALLFAKLRFHLRSDQEVQE